MERVSDDAARRSETSMGSVVTVEEKQTIVSVVETLGDAQTEKERWSAVRQLREELAQGPMAVRDCEEMGAIQILNDLIKAEDSPDIQVMGIPSCRGFLWNVGACNLCATSSPTSLLTSLLRFPSLLQREAAFCLDVIISTEEQYAREAITSGKNIPG